MAEPASTKTRRFSQSGQRAGATVDGTSGESLVGREPRLTFPTGGPPVPVPVGAGTRPTVPILSRGPSPELFLSTG